MGVDASLQDLIRENESLTAELAEARDLLQALRQGRVDALVSSEGDAVYGVQLIALAVDEAESYLDALALLVKKLCESTGFLYGEAWAMTSNGATLERTNAWHGGCTDAIMLHESVTGLALDPPDASLLHTLRSGEPQWILVDALQSSPRAEAIRACEMQTGLLLPLMIGRQPAAVLALWKKERQGRDNAVIARAQKIVSQSAPFVQKKREQEVMQRTLIALERTVRDRTLEMAELSGRLSDQRTKREQAEKLSQDRQNAVVLSEQELKKQTMLLQSILDSMAEGVVVTDPSGRVLQCNPAARKLLGDVPAHLSPQLWADVYGLYQPDKVSRLAGDEMPLAKALRGEAADRVEIFIRGGADPDGRLLAVTARPLVDDSRTIYGAVAVLHDITQYKLEEEQRIQRIEEQRDTLVREVHHRIKNNLAALIELMQRHGGKHPEFKVYLKQVEKQLYALATMYGLEASRDAAIRLDRLLRNVSDNAQLLFGTRVHTAIADNHLGARALREEEAVPVALVLNELLVNACKHGTGDAVEIRVVGDGASVLIDVVNAVKKNFQLSNINTEGRMSGIALVRALLPSKKASLKFKHSNNRFAASVCLPPEIFRLDG